MKKIQFENGTKVSGAKVTIDGVDYPVTPARYTGATPLSAYVMNKLQDNIDNALDNIETEVTNAVEKTGDTMTGALTLKKTSYNYNGGAIPGAKQADATTIEDLINELRYTNGQIGSVQIKTAYTLNNITISTGWYNYSYIPHRMGGIDGDDNEDNTYFGTLMLTGMNISSPIYVLRYYNRGIELTSLATTNVTKNLQTQIDNIQENYSTNEQKIGKWIDGKPLYRKVIKTTMAETSQSGTYVNKDVVTGIHMDFGYVAKTILISGTQYMLLPYINNAGYSTKCFMERKSSNLILANGNSIFNNCEIYAILEYTKTTD